MIRISLPLMKIYLNAILSQRKRLAWLFLLAGTLLCAGSNTGEAHSLEGEQVFLPLVFNQSRHYYAAVTGIDPSMTDVFLLGQSLGNQADVFSKIGDSITDNENFLYPIGQGQYNLYTYDDLQPVITYYSQKLIRNDHNSFSNVSLAARSGWTTGQVLDPAFADPSACQAQESPLVCEYRISRPAVALILLGTNDLGLSVPLATTEANLRVIIETTLDAGIVPVISTVPPINQWWQVQKVIIYNNLIRNLAKDYKIPLWDYYSLMMVLPDYGAGPDGVHPSFPPGEAANFSQANLQYGMTVRNFSALYVLQAVKETVYP